MTSIVTDYFAKRLTDLGYEPRTHRDRPEIWWSLSHCQGDGVTFSADPDMEVMLTRHLKGKYRAAARKIVGEGFKITVRCEGRGFLFPTVDIDETFWKYEDDFTPLQRESFYNLREAVTTEVRDLRRTLTKEGYALLEAINPAWWGLEPSEFGETSWAILRTYRTDRFQVEVKLVEDNDFNPYANFDEPHETVEDMVAGNIIACGIVVTVRTDDGEELGSASLWGVTDTKDMKYIRSEARRLAGDAIAEARKTLHKYVEGIRA